MLEAIERSPFAVDRHLIGTSFSEAAELLDRRKLLHVCGIASGSEDDGDFGGGVDVVGGDECSGGVIDDRF